MNYSTLGRSGIRVSEFALGCWPFAGGKVWGPQEDSDSFEAVHAALDHGINFFDTAEGYDDQHHSEDVLGRALEGRREAAVIATKVSGANLASGKVAEACDSSLRRLRTGHIDLYQIHWPNHEVPIEETMHALERLVAQGKVRALGVCNFGVQDLADLLAAGRIETDQLPYNLLWRPIEVAIKPKCEANDIGLICYSPLAQGLLTGRYASADDVPDGISRSRLFSNKRPLANHSDPGCESEAFKAISQVREIAAVQGRSMAEVALAWVRRQAGVVSLLVGARNRKEVEMNVPAFDVNLADDVVAEMTKSTESVKAKLGSNADMWSSANRMR